LSFAKVVFFTLIIAKFITITGLIKRIFHFFVAIKTFYCFSPATDAIDMKIEKERGG